MNRNQKIALGCGGAGCLGIILILVVCVILGVAGYITVPGISSNRNNNENANANANQNTNVNSNTNSDSTTSSSLSNDDKHKLMQAAAITQDRELMERVLRKLGFITGTNTVSDDYADFIKEHIPWARRNASWVRSVNTPEKGRAYVEEHIGD